MKPVAQGRVFHLDEPNAITTPTIIKGILSVYNFTVRALVDTGATHSFITYNFARNLPIKLEPLG